MPQPGRPGSGSFTTIGSRETMPNGDIADYSRQTHIHVNSKRWDPPQRSPLDHRALDVVNRDGLRQSHPALDNLKPLSETILHELMHALGGSAPPAHRRALITDSPVPPIQQNKIYGYEMCVWMNENRDNPAAIRLGATPLTRADCPTILAKALYLQIQGRATYWSTGVVNPTTLQPSGIQPPQSTSKRRASRIFPRVWGQVV
nr:uncharacterized protein CTRU02_13454 [Colletotrichum truncatum]KAF6783464.1 hypothetical protein CTRU02_13454 [Colletotrichum truncatum]